jgi:hypothetical protein
MMSSHHFGHSPLLLLHHCHLQMLQLMSSSSLLLPLLAVVMAYMAVVMAVLLPFLLLLWRSVAVEPP